MSDRVVVRVPATVANLGPGFDCLGLALAWHNTVMIERADTLAVTAEGPGAETLPTDATNLVARGVWAVLGEGTQVRIHQELAIPCGRGFGSSAAAIIAGIVGAEALSTSKHRSDDLLRAATVLEGHVDNVAPCLLGGGTVSAGGRTLRLAADVKVVVCAAPAAFRTSDARAALPDTVSRTDAVDNIGRAAMLAGALAARRHDLLLAATADRLHQPARFASMPESAALVRALRDQGIAAFLSGAGPSVAALAGPSDAAGAEAAARAAAPDGWDVRLVDVDADGATVIDLR